MPKVKVLSAIAVALACAPVVLQVAQNKAATYITKEQVDTVNKQPGTDRTIRVFDIGPENFAVGVIHRGGDGSGSRRRCWRSGSGRRRGRPEARAAGGGAPAAGGAGAARGAAGGGRGAQALPREPCGEENGALGARWHAHRPVTTIRRPGVVDYLRARAP